MNTPIRIYTAERAKMPLSGEEKSVDRHTIVTDYANSVIYRTGDIINNEGRALQAYDRKFGETDEPHRPGDIVQLFKISKKRSMSGKAYTIRRVKTTPMDQYARAVEKKNKIDAESEKRYREVKSEIERLDNGYTGVMKFFMNTVSLIPGVRRKIEQNRAEARQKALRELESIDLSIPLEQLL